MASDIDKAVANLEDKHWRVRYAAVAALGKSPEAVARHGAAIAQRLEDEDKDVRKAAVQVSPEAVAQHGAAIASVPSLSTTSQSVRATCPREPL